MSSDGIEGDVPVALDAWGIAAERVSRVAGGTLNWNFRVETREGVYFLRCVRRNLETERVAGEHELVAWVSERGIPAPVPIPTPAGETIALVGERRWVLLPWMRGAPVERGTLSAAQAGSLGEMHGRIQAVLAAHPASEGARMVGRWDRQQSLDLLDRLIAQAKERGEAEWIVEGIGRQRRMLDGWDVLPPEAFASMPCQVLHGDFHDQQALFVDDEVSAIVDWEIWHTDPRAWELARSLAFSMLFPSPRMEDYLSGYREHIQLGEEEARLAMRNWFQSRVVGLWAWWAYLIEGNDRVRDFFPEMIAELDRMATPGWMESVTERLIRASGP